MDRINKVVCERKSIKTKEAAKEQLSHLYASRESSKVIGRSQSQAALPNIKHQRRPAANQAFKSEFAVSAANSPTLGHSISVSQMARTGYMESAMNKVKDNQRKQMSVIKADL